MGEMRCSFLADGSSDIALVPLLRWLVRQYSLCRSVAVEWADLGRLRTRPANLCEKIMRAVELFPCDVLFIHRDAEADPPEVRYTEIAAAISEAAARGCTVPHICVVPVRMQEAWLLLDEAAIRRAAGNPNGQMPLGLPRPNCVETTPDPKRVLHDSIKSASGLSGRRLKKLRYRYLASRIPEYMGDDFACLRALPAFCRLEKDVQRVVTGMHRTNALGTAHQGAPPTVN